MNSFEIDPQNPEIYLDHLDQQSLRKAVDRSLRWLFDKISAACINPISVTLDAPGDSNNDIIEALTDVRSLVNLDNLTQD